MFDQPKLSPRCPAEWEDSSRSVLGRSTSEDMAEMRELGVTAARIEGLIYSSMSEIAIRIEGSIRDVQMVLRWSGFESKLSLHGERLPAYMLGSMSRCVISQD